MTSEELHNKAKLTNLTARASNQLKCLMFKRAHLRNDYPILNHNGPTRSSNKIKFEIPRPKYERFKAYPLYHGAAEWDKLEASTQNTDNYLAFKNLIKLPPTHPPLLYRLTKHLSKCLNTYQNGHSIR